MFRAAFRLSALVFLASLAGVSLSGQQPQKTSAVSQAGWTGQKIWGDDTSDDTGRVSADGRFLTFTNWATGELSIRDLANGTNRPLARSTAGGAISPDGTKVAYVSSVNSTRELNIVPVAGGSPQKVALHENARNALNANVEVGGWTADRQELLVLNSNFSTNVAEIGFIHLETGQFRRVATAEPGSYPRLSPDGSRIAVTYLARPDRTQRDIAIIDVASGHSQPLLTGPADDHSADWAPDGQTIYFLSDRDQKAQLWRLRLGPGALRPEPLREAPDGDDSILGVTRDGRVFVGAEDVGGTNSYVADIDWRSGEVRGIRLITHPPLRGSRRTVLSRDGEQVAFLRRARGYGIHPGWQIPVVQSFDGKRERVYDTTLTIRDEPVWSSDGRALFLAMPPEGAVGETAYLKWRFIRLDLERGTYTEVGDAGTAGFQLRLAGLLGDELFYRQLEAATGIGSVVGLNLTTGERRAVYTHSSDITDAAVAPDARRIAFVSRLPDRVSGVFLLNSADAAAPPRLLASLRGQGTVVQVAWSADGQSVLTNGNLDGKFGVWQVPVNGDPPQRLALDFDDITEARASADGRRIAFTRRAQGQREVWEYRAK